MIHDTSSLYYLPILLDGPKCIPVYMVYVHVVSTILQMTARPSPGQRYNTRVAGKPVSP